MMLDLSLLQNLMGGDQQMVDRFISIFKNQVPAHVAQLPLLYENRQWEELSSTLHGLKTQFNYVGLTHFAEQMRRMEEQVDEGITTPVGPQIRDFHSEFGKFWSNAFPAS